MSVVIENFDSENQKIAQPLSVQNDCLLQTSTTEAPLCREEEKQDVRKSLETNQTVGVGNGKKKKHRRGKSKRKPNKPYNKTAWAQRKNSQKEVIRVRSAQAKIFAMGHTLVPCNTNQFLMEDHGVPQPRVPSARTRDSSFSVDSEDNYFMSLPEDEEDFLTKEFSSVYEDAQCERLNAMTKNELIQECIMMESRLDHLSKTIRNVKPIAEQMHIQSDSELDVAARTKIQEQAARIQELLTENLELRRERDYYASARRPLSSTSTDSESDSSMHSSSMSSPSSSMEESATEVMPTVRNCPVAQQGSQNSSPNTCKRSSSPPENIV